MSLMKLGNVQNIGDTRFSHLLSGKAALLRIMTFLLPFDIFLRVCVGVRLQIKLDVVEKFDFCSGTFDTCNLTVTGSLNGKVLEC